MNVLFPLSGRTDGSAKNPPRMWLANARYYKVQGVREIWSMPLATFASKEINKGGAGNVRTSVRDQETGKIRPTFFMECSGHTDR